MGGHPQDIINRQLLHDADIVIGIFGTRIGTPTSEYLSGTVEEIKRDVADGKTAKVYFSDVPIAPSELNATQYALVLQFREECRSTGLYATFGSIQDFSRDFGHHLNIELNQPRYRWLAAPESSSVESITLSQDALRLLKAVAATDDGMVILQESLGGNGLRVGEQEFMDGTPRSEAKWRSALAELDRAGTLEGISENIYRMTDAGYRVADGSEDPTESKVSVFDELRIARTREILDALNYRQRDLLRFLLLQGGSARSDVIHRAWGSPSGGFDWNGLSRPLADKGLVNLAQDLTEGHTTVSVNEGMSDALKELLFPRKEDGTNSDFTGV
jgi:hypothetical protein